MISTINIRMHYHIIGVFIAKTMFPVANFKCYSEISYEKTLRHARASYDSSKYVILENEGVE